VCGVPGAALRSARAGLPWSQRGGGCKERSRWQCAYCLCPRCHVPVSALRALASGGWSRPGPHGPGRGCSGSSGQRRGGASLALTHAGKPLREGEAPAEPARSVGSRLGGSLALPGARNAIWVMMPLSSASRSTAPLSTSVKDARPKQCSRHTPCAVTAHSAREACRLRWAKRVTVHGPGAGTFSGPSARSKSPCVILGDTGRGNQSCKILRGRGSRRAVAFGSARLGGRVWEGEFGRARLLPSRCVQRVLGSAGAPPTQNHEDLFSADTQAKNMYLTPSHPAQCSAGA
jgi:hypothetical protein